MLLATQRNESNCKEKVWDIVCKLIEYIDPKERVLQISKLGKQHNRPKDLPALDSSIYSYTGESGLYKRLPRCQKSMKTLIQDM